MPHDDRTFELTVVIYFVIPTLVMRLPAGPLGPLLGPLVVFPTAAIEARCVHDINTRDAHTLQSAVAAI